MSKYDSRIGERLRDVRISRNMSIKKAAEKANVAIETWARFERGEHYPRFTTIMDICKILDISIDYILYGIDGHKSIFAEFDSLSANDKTEAYKLLSNFKKLNSDDKKYISTITEALVEFRKERRK